MNQHEINSHLRMTISSDSEADLATLLLRRQKYRKKLVEIERALAKNKIYLSGFFSDEVDPSLLARVTYAEEYKDDESLYGLRFQFDGVVYLYRLDNFFDTWILSHAENQDVFLNMSQQSLDLQELLYDYRSFVYEHAPRSSSSSD